MARQAVDVVIIGAGQCGLALGHRLRQAGRDVLILDGAPAIGHSWRDRYDSLRLFTPTALNSLPGMRFPKTDSRFPTKDEVADFLALYAQRMKLPVCLNARVHKLRPVPEGYDVHTRAVTYTARQVVVATGAFHTPRTPSFSAALSPDVFQVHSSRYRNPDGLPSNGSVLVVGAGNSGAQIALELAARRKTVLAVGGRPFYSSPAWLLERLWAWRIARFRMLHWRTPKNWPWPLGNTQGFFVGDFFRQARERGLELVSRVVSAHGNEVVLADQRTLRVDCIVWATGYRNDYSWIDMRVFGENGAPVLEAQARAAPGLYFIGLWRQRTVGSALIAGVPSDSAYVARLLDEEAGTSTGATLLASGAAAPQSVPPALSCYSA